MTEERFEKLLRRANSSSAFSGSDAIRFVEASEGRAVAKLKLVPQVMNTWGVPHGGALFTMGDVACGIAALTMRQETLLTLNANIDFMDAASPDGEVTAIAKVERMGGKACFCSAEMFDCNGKRIAKMSAVMYYTGKPIEM